MCLRVFFIALLFPLIANAQEGNFKWQNPLPQGNDLNGCCCTSGMFAWAVGYAGTIIKSTDKGATWTIQNSGVVDQLNGVSFIDSLKGWACGNSGTILYTCDGGELWVQQTVPGNPNLEDIQFIDPEKGWAAGRAGIILNTTNGGESWIEQPSNTHYNLYSLHFADTLVGYAVGNLGNLVKTINGGDTWQLSEYFNADYYFSSVFFINPDTGWICGLMEYPPDYAPIVLKTKDGGIIWTLQQLNSQDPYDIFFTDSQHGYMCGRNSVIYETDDGGETWQSKMWGGEYHDLNSVSFFDENYAVGVGREAHIIRKLGGPFYIWKYNETGTIEHLDDIFFIDEFNGWAVGWNNTLLHTTDGGETWISVQSALQSYQSPISISFPDDQNGWISGRWGGMIHTIDGGVTWFSQTTNADEYINSVFFIDKNYGWAVGNNDIRLRTTDGGQIWLIWTSGESFDLEDVFFIDHLNGWMVGSDGVIFNTTNGGAIWSMQNPHNSEHLYSVFFTTEHSGWAVGAESTILFTSDGGQNWISKENSANNDLYDIYFINELNGWISGGNGTIMHTIDGGSTWVIEDRITDNSLEAIIFKDQNSGWVCGSFGTILTYHPDSPVSVDYSEYNSKKVPDQTLHIFPNPCNAISEVRLSPGSYNRISIYDMEGKLIKSINEHEIENLRDQEIIIDLHDFPPGVYLVEARKGKKSMVEKIIVF
jgi:photosystem II stability/assembly factor-like uncharacterized protein